MTAEEIEQQLIGAGIKAFPSIDDAVSVTPYSRRSIERATRCGDLIAFQAKPGGRVVLSRRGIAEWLANAGIGRKGAPM